MSTKEKLGGENFEVKEFEEEVSRTKKLTRMEGQSWFFVEEIQHENLGSLVKGGFVDSSFADKFLRENKEIFKSQAENKI